MCVCVCAWDKCVSVYIVHESVCMNMHVCVWVYVYECIWVYKCVYVYEGECVYDHMYAMSVCV